YESESLTGNRNRAIAYLLKNSNVFDGEVDDIVETYFRQCSTLVDCRDLGIIAATLASTGVNPVTRQRVLRENTVKNVLSVMASCGMYDGAGDWLYSVGLPAKSGVAGGIIAVLPGQLGIAIYSPALDVHGNSFRGVKVCEELSETLHLHVMSPQRRPAPPVRSSSTIVEARSKHLRSEPEQEVLEQHGSEVRVIQLQGEILFAAGELVTNAVLDENDGVRHTILDFGAVRAVAPIVVPILSHLVESFESDGRELLFSSTEKYPAFVEHITDLREKSGLHPIHHFPDLDMALEWAENELISEYGPNEIEVEIPIAEHPATEGMSAAEVERLTSRLERRFYPAGTRIYEQVGQVDEMLFVTLGSINVLASDSKGRERRIATIPSGMTLGEVAMLSERRRLGISVAAVDVVAYALKKEELETLREEEPALACAFLENLMKLIALRVGHMSRELIR
ncbi:MAG: glutaminase, partial [Solirubrobacterales bacterium]